MSSRRTEDSHIEKLNQLFSDSGLECLRSAVESEESSSESGEAEELGKVEEEQELVVEADLIADIKSQVEEEIIEEQPEIFPTPSLRRVLPDRLRKIEEQNRIHVLPEEFKTDFDSTLIPKIATTPQQRYIDILGELTGCVQYKKSLAEFWFLDTLANLLRRAQDDEMDRPSQAILILWFCEWMKEIQHFDAADRQRMLKRFQHNMLSAARFIGDEEHLPTPLEAGVFYKPLEEVSVDTSATSRQSRHLVTFENAAYECSMRDLINIMHYIYDLFSTDYQYDIVRSIFTFSPEYNLIDTPYQVQNPKRLFAPLKIKPKKDKPKKEGKPQKGKKKEVDTEEYLALLELRARDEKLQDEQEEIDRENWHRRQHILPLQFAADDAFFDKYWPPPPPEPEPEPEPEPKGKKGKGKK